MIQHKIMITDHISDIIYEETNIMVPAGGDFKLFVLLADRLVYHCMSRYMEDPENAPKVIRMYASITFGEGNFYLAGYKAVSIYNETTGNCDISIGFSDEETGFPEFDRSINPRTYWI